MIYFYFTEASDEFSRIHQSARRTQQYMYAPASARNIRSHFRTYLLFCLHFNRGPLPANSDTLVCFIEYMSQSCGFQHIKHLLGSVRLLHRIYGIEFLEDDYQLDSALQSIKRKCAGTPLQVFPILPKTMLSMLLFMDLSDPQMLALWTAWLVSFFLMFRKKSAVPETLAKFDPELGLSRKKISIYPEKNLALVYVNFSKVIQFREKHMILPLVGIPNSHLNVVYFLNKLFTEHVTPEDAPAFSYYKNGRLLCITYALFTKKLKECLKLAGLNPDLYSGHSFRRGGATWAHKSGCSSTMIKFTGDWSSNCFLQYTWSDIEERMSTQLRMVSSIT